MLNSEVCVHLKLQRNFHRLVVLTKTVSCTVSHGTLLFSSVRIPIPFLKRSSDNGQDRSGPGMASAVQEEGGQGEEFQGVCQDQTGCQEGSQSHVHNDTELLADSGSGDPGGMKNGEDARDTGQDEHKFTCEYL